MVLNHRGVHVRVRACKRVSDGGDPGREPWWLERLEGWAKEGWDVDATRATIEEQPDRASEVILQVEQIFNEAGIIRQRLEDIPERHRERLSHLEEALTDPEQIHQVRAELDRFEMRWRPWGAPAAASRQRWIDGGKLERLVSLCDRFDALDPNLIDDARPMAEHFLTPDASEVLENGIDDLERKQASRFERMEAMADLLERKGFDVLPAREGSLRKRALELERLQHLEEQWMALSKEIHIKLSPWSQTLVDLFQKERAELQRTGKDEDLDKMRSELKEVILDRTSRLAEVETTITALKSEGWAFWAPDAVKPIDLIEWEGKNKQLKRLIDDHITLGERLRVIGDEWSLERDSLVAYIHDLERTDELERGVSRLEQEMEACISEGRQSITQWKDDGFTVDDWFERVEKAPKAALGDISSHDALIVRAQEAIRALDKVDVTIDGDDDADELRMLLYNDVRLDVILECEEWVQSQRKRNERYRRRLLMSVTEFRGKGTWPGDINPEGWTLQRLEGAIHVIERGGVLTDVEEREEGEGKTQSPTIFHPRLRVALEHAELELKVWGEEGWDTGVLLEELKRDPMRTGQRLDSIRSAMERHEEIIERLRILPWGRDTDLAEQVLSDLRRPDRLMTLIEGLPALRQRLMKGAGTGEFDFEPWRPIYIEVEDPFQVGEYDVGDFDVSSWITTPSMGQDQNDGGEYTSELNDFVEMEEDLPEVIADTLVEPLTKEEGGASLPSFDGEGDYWQQEEVDNNEEGSEKEDSETETESDEERERGAGVEIVEREGKEERESIRRLAELIGWEGGGLAKDWLDEQIGCPPRDMRWDRLFNLALRLDDDKGSDELEDERNKGLQRLENLAAILMQWTKKRLEGRETSTAGTPLEQAARLGHVLKRIPGPSISLPLEMDSHILPDSNDVHELVNEVESLASMVDLPMAHGIKTIA